MKTKQIVATGLTWLPALLLAASALAKLAGAKPIVENLTKVGFIPYFPLPSLALVELLCVAAFLTPRSSRVGFFLLCGYLGGAGAIDLALHMPPIALVLLTLIWIGAYLKDKTLFFPGPSQASERNAHEPHRSGFEHRASLLTENAPPAGQPGALQ